MGWFSDDHAIYTNKLLTELKRTRELEYKILMNYYFTYQRQDLTSERFRMRHEKISLMIQSGLAYMDGLMTDVA